MSVASFTIKVAAAPLPGSAFNPRTMSIAQIQAATGIQVPEASLVKKGAMMINKSGTYENMDYAGQVTVEVSSGKVLFKNCRFNGGGGGYGVLNIPERFQADEIRFEFCEIRNAQNGIAGANLYVYRCDISEWENGVNFWGPGQLVESYIHDEKAQGSDPHFDGTECNGGGNIKIFRSYVINGHSQAAALMFNNEFGALHDIEVDGNYVAGGGYTIYFDTSKQSSLPTTNIKVTNNTIKKGYWGHTALYNSGVKIDTAGGNQLI